MIGEVVTISDFGNTDPRRVPIAGVQWSRELSNVGTFSGFCRMEDLRDAGLYDDLVGKWITYTHPGAPEWGGVITGRPTADGVAEIGADGFGALLGAQVAEAWDRQSIGVPAAIARRALTLVGNDIPLFVKLGTIDEGGSSVSFSLGGQRMLDDVLPLLAESGELEWIVDLDRKLHMGRHIGRDRSAKIRLVEGRHFVEPDLADDMWTRTPARAYFIESDESTARRMIRRGRIETTEVVPEYVTQGLTFTLGSPHRHKKKKRGGLVLTFSSVVDVIWTTVTKITEFISLPELTAGLATWPDQPAGTSTHSLAVPTGKGLEPQSTPCQLTVLNRDDMWRRVDLGDVVKIEIGSAGFSGWFRLMVQALDTTSGVMTWAGEALPDGRTA